MNKGLRYTIIAVALMTAIALAPNTRAQNHNWTGKKPVPGATPAPAMAPVKFPAIASAATDDKKTSAGESFFIVASVDQTKSQVLLKRPTEVTLLVNVNANTKFFDDSGQPLKISDFRAGDTVWVTTSGGDQPAATRIRKGQLTVADLHHYYLDFPEIK